MLVWDKKDGKQGIVQAKIEYREMDFYGPFCIWISKSTKMKP